MRNSECGIMVSPCGDQRDAGPTSRSSFDENSSMRLARIKKSVYL